MQGISLQWLLHFWTIDYKPINSLWNCITCRKYYRMELALMHILNSNKHFHLEKLLLNVNYFSVIPF